MNPSKPDPKGSPAQLEKCVLMHCSEVDQRRPLSRIANQTVHKVQPACRTNNRSHWHPQSPPPLAQLATDETDERLDTKCSRIHISRRIPSGVNVQSGDASFSHCCGDGLHSCQDRVHQLGQISGRMRKLALFCKQKPERKDHFLSRSTAFASILLDADAETMQYRFRGVCIVYVTTVACFEWEGIGNLEGAGLGILTW